MIIYLLIAVSVLISVAATGLITRNVYIDVAARKKAKERYNKDPELGVLVEDYYVPSVTIGELLVGITFWVTPGLNLLTAIFVCVVEVVLRLRKVWNNPVIDW